MILVDSSVWIDYLQDVETLQTCKLDELIGRHELLTGDLILAEVLQGCRSDRHFALALEELTRMPVIRIGGRAVAIQAARNHRALRAKGITVRKTIDSLIAARCIADDYELLYSDRDFEPFVAHLGLRTAL